MFEWLQHYLGREGKFPSAAPLRTCPLRVFGRHSTSFFATFLEWCSFLYEGDKECPSDAVAGERCPGGVHNPSSEAGCRDFSIRRSFSLRFLAFLVQSLKSMAMEHFCRTNVSLKQRTHYKCLLESGIDAWQVRQRLKPGDLGMPLRITFLPVREDMYTILRGNWE